MKGQTAGLPENGFFTKVAGSSYEARQEAIDATLPEVGVFLVREKDNAYDPHAIMVIRQDDGRQVGYLKAAYTPYLADYAEYMDLCAIVTEVTGGTIYKPLRGVNLYVYDQQERPLPLPSNGEGE